jgi:16S rRNA (cytidine1402-2'-O)-methyltransferase
MSGKLTIVGTPIGNMQDITVRAFQALTNAKYIVCEDTRRTGQLLGQLKLKIRPLLNPELNLNASKAQLISYRDQNHDRAMPQILQLLQQGEELFLVTDSGMPAISDPGYKLIRDVYAAGFAVDVLPGPTAPATAMALGGLPTDKFVFLGFLPKGNGSQRTILETYLPLPATLVLFESPFRVIKFFKQHQELLEGREVAVCCELTKMHQRIHKGSVEEVLVALNTNPPRGEITLLIGKLL